MPVLIQENIACELGLLNGTPGVFRQLIYDQTSGNPTDSDEGIFTADTLLVRNAHYALIEIPKSKIRKLDSLDPLIIPVPVIEKTFEVNLEKLYADKGPIMKMFRDKKLNAMISVKRKALPLVPAYSVTTHKSQGPTLPKIVIDLEYATRNGRGRICVCATFTSATTNGSRHFTRLQRQCVASGTVQKTSS